MKIAQSAYFGTYTKYKLLYVSYNQGKAGEAWARVRLRLRVTARGEGRARHCHLLT